MCALLTHGGSPVGGGHVSSNAPARRDDGLVHTVADEHDVRRVPRHRHPLVVNPLIDLDHMNLGVKLRRRVHRRLNRPELPPPILRHHGVVDSQVVILLQQSPANPSSQPMRVTLSVHLKQHFILINVNIAAGTRSRSRRKFICWFQTPSVMQCNITRFSILERT